MMNICLNQDTQDSRIYRIETVKSRITPMRGKNRRNADFRSLRRVGQDARPTGVLRHTEYAYYFNTCRPAGAWVWGGLRFL